MGRAQQIERLLATLPRDEQMVVAQARNHVRADSCLGQACGKRRRQPNRIQARMDAEADPRPFAGRVRADCREPSSRTSANAPGRKTGSSAAMNA
jgi:hypothetical protein